MNNINFRKLTLNDLDGFIPLRIAQMREEGAEAPETLFDALVGYYTAHITDDSFVSYIACANGIIVATSGISFVSKPPFEGNSTGIIGLVSGMYTLPSYRRQGVAASLLSLIADEAKKRGCTFIEVTSSQAGLPLYKSFGFEVNERVFQYKL